MPKPPRAKFLLLLELNLWALILDGLGLLFLASGLFAGSLLDNFWIVIPGVVLFFVFVPQGLRIHGTTPRKVRAYYALLARNRHSFRDDTFRPFLNSPCGRILVHAALRRLGCPEAYRVLKAKYRPTFCSFENALEIEFVSPPPTTVHDEN